MKKLDGRRSATIDGVEVITTSEICRLIGLTLSVKQIKDFANMSPYAEIHSASYWRTSDLPVIAASVAARLADFSACFQLVLRIEGEEHGK